MKKYNYIDGMYCFDVYPADEVDAKIAELEAQLKRACHVVEVNRQAKWKAENRVAELEAENGRLRGALTEAAQSLETVERDTGRSELMSSWGDVRGYANSRARVAREALKK